MKCFYHDVCNVRLYIKRLGVNDITILNLISPCNNIECIIKKTKIFLFHIYFGVQVRLALFARFLTSLAFK